MKKAKDLKPGVIPCRFTAFFDGCTEPVNPGGTAGYGAVIFDKKGGHPLDAGNNNGLGVRVHDVSAMIPAAPTTSNNVAEYLAVGAILDWLIENGHQTESCQIYGDSRLIICQLWGWPVPGKRWKIHGVDTEDKPMGLYAPYAVAAREKLTQIKRTTGHWIPREENNIADELSKAQLKAAGIEFRIQPETEDA